MAWFVGKVATLRQLPPGLHLALQQPVSRHLKYALTAISLNFVYRANVFFLPPLPSEISIGSPCNVIGHCSSQLPWAHIFLFLPITSTWSLNNSFPSPLPAGISACWTCCPGCSLGVHTGNVVFSFVKVHKLQAVPVTGELGLWLLQPVLAFM